MFTDPLRMEDPLMIPDIDDQLDELLTPVTIRGHIFAAEAWSLPSGYALTIHKKQHGYRLTVDGKSVGLFGTSVSDALARFRRVLEINRAAVVPMDRLIGVLDTRASWAYVALGVAGPNGETTGYRKRSTGEWPSGRPNEVYTRYAGQPVGAAGLDVYFVRAGQWLVTRPAGPESITASRIGDYDGFLELTEIPLHEREETYNDVREQQAERYADAGSSHVFGGGSVADAMLVGAWAVGPTVTREEYGLPPEPEPPSYIGYVGGPPTTDAPVAPTADDDIPF